MKTFWGAEHAVFLAAWLACLPLIAELLPFALARFKLLGRLDLFELPDRRLICTRRCGIAGTRACNISIYATYSLRF